jgi:hypothetical protein
MMRAIWAQMIVYFVLIILLATGLILAVNGEAYDCKKAENWVWRARATNDLTDMAKYTSRALEELGELSGNPSWWFPAPDTDYDLIKSNMEEVIRNCAVINVTMDTMAYQQAVNNLQETLAEIADHIHIARDWVVWNLFNVIILILMCVVWLPILLILGL